MVATAEAFDLSKLRAGDSSEWSRLMARLSPGLLRFAERYRTDDAEDVVSETWRKAWLGIGKFNEGDGDPKALTGWVYAIARNHALTNLRTARRRPATVSTDPAGLDWVPAGSYCVPDRPMERDRLQDLLALVKPHRRLAAYLRWECGWEYESIRELLDLPRGTVGSVLNRARADIKRRYANV